VSTRYGTFDELRHQIDHVLDDAANDGELSEAMFYLSSHSVPVNSINLIAIGSNGSGKTKTIKTLLGETSCNLSPGQPSKDGSHVPVVSVTCSSQMGFSMADGDMTPLERALLYCQRELNKQQDQSTQVAMVSLEDEYDMHEEHSKHKRVRALVSSRAVGQHTTLFRRPP